MLIRLGLSFVLLSVSISRADDGLGTTYLQVAETFDLEPCLLQALIDWEGGEVGENVYHSNGSVDIGLAQISKGGEWYRHFLGLGISEDQLRDNPHVAILAAGYVLRTELDRTNDIIKALSAYHRGLGRADSVSGYRYSQKVLGRYNLLISKNMCYIPA